jgi:hypothetical protein
MIGKVARGLATAPGPFNLPDLFGLGASGTPTTRAARAGGLGPQGLDTGSAANPAGKGAGFGSSS